MNFPLLREFKLSPAGSGRGTSCDSNGAYIGNIALLKRIDREDGATAWQPRQSGELSLELSTIFGVPVDFSSKSGGVSAIASALNEGNVARAQLIALNLRIPDPPPEKDTLGRDDLMKLVRHLWASNLIKVDWDPDEHPRWPAGAPDSQGGQFAPKDEGDDRASFGDDSSDRNTSPSGLPENFQDRDIGEPGRASNSPAPIPATYVQDEEGGQLEDVVYRGDFHDQVVEAYADYLRSAGFKVETELPMQMADRSGGTRIDVLAQMAGVTFGVEVKTGERPSLTLSQLLVYPHMIYGESVISDNPRITTFGYERGEVLPPIPVVLMYVRSPSSKPDFDELDAEKMTEEYLRRLRLLSKSFEVGWLFRNMSGG